MGRLLVEPRNSDGRSTVTRKKGNECKCSLPVGCGCQSMSQIQTTRPLLCGTFLPGCDGARSTEREILGIKLDGPGHATPARYPRDPRLAVSGCKESFSPACVSLLSYPL